MCGLRRREAVSRRNPVLRILVCMGVVGDGLGWLVWHYARICCDGVHWVHFGIDGWPVFDLSEDRNCAPELRDMVSTVVVP